MALSIGTRPKLVDNISLNKRYNTMHQTKFVIYIDASRHYRWRLVAANGETIASSGEAFYDKANARRAAELVKLYASAAPIEG